MADSGQRPRATGALRRRHSRSAAGLNLQSDSFCLGRLGYAYAHAGRRSAAFTLLKRMLDEHSRSYISPYHIGVVYLGLGDLDQVFSWFERAYDDRVPDLMVIKIEPLLDAILFT